MAGLGDTLPGSHRHRKAWTKLLIGIFHLFLLCIRQGRAQLQALAQMSSVVEVWQAEEADVIFPAQSEERHREGFPADGSAFFVRESGRALQFQPSVLEFGAQPLGLPRAETVYINNPSRDQPVTLLSVFSSSGHFHVPAFHRRVIPPQGKASFKLIFFPTEEGNVESTLFINTSSHGVLSYQVSGVGVHHGPYKDQQIKHSHLVFPHIQSINVTQTQDEASNMTTVGLQLECSLPKTSVGHPQGSCLLTNEKLVVKISLSDRGEKHSGLERFKPYVIENIVVLFHVVSGRRELWEPGINIYMLNSGGKVLYVKDVELLSRIEASVDFRQAPLGTAASNFTRVASLVCRGSSPDHKAECPTHLNVRVLDRFTLNTYPAIGLTHRHFEKSGPVVFLLKQEQNRGTHTDVWLTNGLSVPFSITHAAVSPDMDGLMKVVNFSGPATVPPGCWKLFSLQFASRKAPVNLVTSVFLLSSLGPHLELPLHIHSAASQGNLPVNDGGECGIPCQLGLSRAGRVQWQESHTGGREEDGSWRVDGALAAKLDSRWGICKHQLSCIWPRFCADPGTPLDFGATPVNDSKLKYFTLKNPSSTPVSMELLPISSYSAPLEALDLLTKWFKMNPISVNVATAEFTFQSIKVGSRATQVQDHGPVRVRLGPWESVEIGLLFTPAEHKPVTSLILIRNNLTVLDVVPVRGFGAREMVRLGGKLPGGGASLRFSVPQSTLMECRDGLKAPRPLLTVTKSFKVENAGELPLTIVSMNINGYKCRGFGFEVLECRSLQLNYNSSSEISIVFTPDFTSSWVIRDLTLVTRRGSSFSFTLNVTLPHHMLPLCAPVVPGPSWEQAFWLFTLLFTCVSLSGVCLMAVRQAQGILADFCSPRPRAHHSPQLPRGNSRAVDTITPNTVSKSKGSCKAFADACNASDKGRGKGSPSVSGTSARSPASTKKGSSAAAQPQKKHKVSVYYGRYKVNPAVATSAAAAGEERDDPPSCQSGNDSPVEAKPPASPGVANLVDETHVAPEGYQEQQAVMFPMETSPVLQKEEVDLSGMSPPLYGQAEGSGYEDAPSEWLPLPISCVPDRKVPEKREELMSEFLSRTGIQGNGYRGTIYRRPAHREIKKEPEARRTERGDSASYKGKKDSSRNRRKPGEGTVSVHEHSVVMLSEKNRTLEWREGRNPNKSRNRCSNRRTDGPKLGTGQDWALKKLPNGVCPTRPRRRGGAERRRQWESGSDSGSSSGSTRADRGSRGSWGSASSLEGERDPGARTPCTSSAPATKTGDSAHHMAYPIESDRAPTDGNRTVSISNLPKNVPHQAPVSASLPNSSPSFSAVSAGGEGTPGMPYETEETWAAPSVPFNTDLRHSTAQSPPLLPPASHPGLYHSFPWKSVNSKCTGANPHCEPSNYLLGGNVDLQNGFLCQENPNMAFSQKSCWSADHVQEIPSVWDTTGAMGAKPFLGTRSLSPMSGLFGSIWTPHSNPYQNRLQPDLPVPLSPQTPFSRQVGGINRPKPYSSFNLFGPRMNLDIWNSSSNGGPNSQLFSDYRGEV